ncbi:PIN domain-containing protein [Archangium sp.]|jgi:predicted nucleic-acid-binding protein|uniref:PIN domain-containing protein n=1 Tax=Archangium sp. TaxID=1872627 RepID=UPI002ED9A6AB
MTAHLPLLVFDTNILMDIWLGRDGNQATLLLELAEEKRIELVVPEYVLLEFQGTALRYVQGEKAKLGQQVRPVVNGWLRSKALGEEAADLIHEGLKRVEQRLAEQRKALPEIAKRIASIARVARHTPDVHFRGDLRHLAGAPPDRPVDGLNDCRIYEAILEIARADRANERTKIMATKDNDFDYPELKAELANLGFTIRNDLGALYGEFRGKP